MKVDEETGAKEQAQEDMGYENSGIDERILRAVKEMGFENMTPIQKQAIPILMEGRDVIGQAQTGTGKTAAFGIPMLQRIDENDRSLQGIILCPTRELAIQAAEELRKFSKYMHGVKMVPIYGGQDISRQIKALKGGVQIIVGTPGRVMDHMRRHTIKLQNVKMVILDEADEMLDMGFREDMETILGEIENEHQTALFSATMPQAILDITDKYQKDAELIKVTKKELTIPLIKQYYFVVKSVYKEEVISRLLELHGFKRSIIFCNTKRMVDELAENLKNRGYQAEGLHGDMTQKQRDFVMNRFKNGSLEILIATDVAARGIDVDDLEAVFNYDVPQDIEYYVHRIGRTGRAGKEGMAFTFAYGRDLYRIRDIERVCKTKMTEMRVPKAKQVMDVKVDKVIASAVEKAEVTDLENLKEKIEEKITELGADPMELLAALVRMQVGDNIQEIVVEEPKKEGIFGRRGERRRGAEGGQEGRRSRRSGRGREEERGERHGSRGRGEEKEGRRSDRKFEEEKGSRRSDRRSEEEKSSRRDSRSYGEEKSRRRDSRSFGEEKSRRHDSRSCGEEKESRRDSRSYGEEKESRRAGRKSEDEKGRRGGKGAESDKKGKDRKLEGEKSESRRKKKAVDVRRDGSPLGVRRK
ncbi:MAG: DEAD/DEAH box helicase [Lachnospiraceae bacterium]|nr:DEAD/DEAH box helicase [Lachnospiraceae bacterium]